jgi:hypothetical protein
MTIRNKERSEFIQEHWLVTQLDILRKSKLPTTSQNLSWAKKEAYHTLNEWFDKLEGK